MSTQTQRVLAALRHAGTRGITQSDFAPPEGGTVIDGGGRITRVAARIRDLRDLGHGITTGPDRDGFTTYVLTHLKREHGPVLERLPDGWIRTHYCRACDFPGQRPCGPVCPTCGRDAVLTLDYDARPVVAERKAA